MRRVSVLAVLWEVLELFLPTPTFLQILSPTTTMIIDAKNEQKVEISVGQQNDNFIIIIFYNR